MVALTLSSLCVPRAAFAQSPSPHEIATAEVLFQDAKKLMAAAKYAEACPKLVESQKLDPGGGTLVTLALCHEAEGKTASAWAEFGEALTIALKDGRVDRATVAREHAARIEPKLSLLTIRVPPLVADLGALQILEDGVALGRAAWGTALPVDPGEHVIEARAPGKKSWTRILLIAPNGDRQATEVAPLEDDIVPQVPKAAPVDSGSAKRKAAWITGGVGVVLVGAAGYFGWQAIADHDEAKRLCPGPTSTCVNIDGVNLNESSRREADLATAGFALGGVALGVATYLLLTSPSSKTVALAPALAGRTGGAALTLHW